MKELCIKSRLLTGYLEMLIEKDLVKERSGILVQELLMMV